MISVGFISTLDRLRSIDRKQVEALAASIKEVGLLNPITVYKREIIRNGQPVEGFGLVAGAHRLEACKSLGWSEVPAIVVDLSDDERIIAECDENLCGSKLTASEQAMFTATRKEAYLRMHPETAHGRNQHSGGLANSATPTFADDQSEKTGTAARTVRQNAERGEKITTAALAMVKGTDLDTGVFLDKLKKIKPENQVEYVEKALREASRPKPKPPKVAADPLSGPLAMEKQVARLMDAWNAASPDAREEFLGRIESPVMDARFS
jgi:ParB family transcriptional regulator, chromosome partitioning protein